VPLSAFRKDKFAADFASWDSDNDGVIEAADFDLAAEKMAKLRDMPPGGAQASRVRDAYREMWTEWFAPADRDHDGKVAAAEYQMTHEWLDQMPREQLQASAGKLIGAAFDAFDLDADGKISESEYMAFVEVHGNPKGAEDNWPTLDTNHDGHLARDEFVNLMLEYYATDDTEAPGNKIFGQR
jgi:Ca2+-binding EF-hand superfamily protein